MVGKKNICNETYLVIDQLSMEEAFYLCDIPKCLKILGEGNCTEDINQMWDYMVQPRHLLMQLLEARWNPE